MVALLPEKVKMACQDHFCQVAIFNDAAAEKLPVDFLQRDDNICRTAKRLLAGTKQWQPGKGGHAGLGSAGGGGVRSRQSS